jgi:hypothetical protein
LKFYAADFFAERKADDKKFPPEIYFFCRRNFPLKKIYQRGIFFKNENKKFVRSA